MIEYIICIPQAIYESYCIVEWSGMGLRVTCSRSCSNAMQVNVAGKLYTEIIFKENAQAIYGFINTQEREIFRIITSVHGIGPKIAINLLSVLTSQILITCIVEKNEKLLCSIQGISKKLAQRIITELESKIALLIKTNNDVVILQPPQQSSMIKTIGAATTCVSNMHDAQAALIVLGYPIIDIMRSTNFESDNMSTEDIIKKALANLNTKL